MSLRRFQGLKSDMFGQSNQKELCAIRRGVTYVQYEGCQPPKIKRDLKWGGGDGGQTFMVEIYYNAT